MSKKLNLPRRIYSQYADKPKAVAWLNVTREIGENLAKGADDVRKCLDIDTATGESLKIISRIVGVDKTRIEVLMNSAEFAMQDGPNSGTEFGDTANTFAPWSTQSDAKISEDVLRTLCRAKILKNSIIPTSENLLDAFNTIFPTANAIRLLNHHDMSFSMEFTGTISQTESWLLDVEDFIPTPQGVRFRGFIRSFGMIEFLSDSANSDFGDETMEFLE